MTITPSPAWRGDPVWLPEVLREFGVTVRELPGWRDWGNGDFGAIKGIIVHHTGHNATSAEYIARNPGLDGGLSSQIHLSREGVATICGAGIAWHAGRGAYPGWQTDNANWESIGIEAQADGTSPWPQAQLDAYYRICAAILTKLGKRATPQTLLSHWEYSLQAQGKWDPGAGDGVPGHLMDMDRFRASVNHYIDNPPGQPKEELDMNAVDRIITYIRDFITGFVGPIGSDVKDIREQLTGSRDKGQYAGWRQLGCDKDGRALSLVDGVAATRADIARIESKLDRIIEGSE